MALYTVRSERQFCEQLSYNLLFRYFLDLGWRSAPSTRAESHRRMRQVRGVIPLSSPFTQTCAPFGSDATLRS